ncbi:MAG: DNA repair protein RecN [Caldilineales bacterium]|nr:DNA repair protein RecN [Caldilineales bacterium]
MLTELHVRSFAIIDDLQVAFHPGFNVLTGETGAGKSIIIDAIELLLGARASQEMVRAGAEIATIEGLFTFAEDSQAEIKNRLAAEGLDGDDDLLILAREVRLGGRSVARINGRAVAQTLLGEIGGQLIDIHGQGQHLSLLNPRRHIDFLDAFGNHEDARAGVSELVGRLRQVRAALDELRRDAREIARRLDLLNYQVEEIDAAGLEIGEDESLESERRRLANAETLARQCAAIQQLLVDGDGEAPPALDLIAEAAGRLDKLTRVDPDLTALYAQAEDVNERLNDLARGLAAYADSIAHDPARLTEVEERVGLISQLKRKYGDTIAEVIAFGEEARAELEHLSGHETRTVDLEIEEDDLLHAIGRETSALSAARAVSAEKLSQAIERELEDLHMSGTRFEVEMARTPSPDGCYVGDGRLAFDASGIDQVQFLVSANPGEPLRPLVKVASGGETARLMLALKNVLSQADDTPTLIFDEIDQGIGGRVGAIVGRKMHDLSQRHQVLCVTHLPQIAAYGDHHLVVHKEVESARTVTRLDELDGPPRVAELAAMMGANSEAGRLSAAELLADVGRYKQQIANPA